MPKRSDNGQSPIDYIKLFETLGCSFTDSNSTEVVSECPRCFKEKFYLNKSTGQFDCKVCGWQGNSYTFVSDVHASALETTTDKQYHELRDKRGLSLQTLKRHHLAYVDGTWLLPFKSVKGSVQNLQMYDLESNFKRYLPSLPVRLYGLDQLKDAPAIYLCEGPWDAIALDAQLRKLKTRMRYGLLAVPGANIFKREWSEYFEGKTVYVLYDNDDAGRKGSEKVAKVLKDQKSRADVRILRWPDGFPEKHDIGDLIQDDVGITTFAKDHSTKAERKRIKFHRASDIETKTVEWLWDGHIPFATFAAFSGEMGTAKSTIARDIAARATAGKPMPSGGKTTNSFDVLYFTSEDSASTVVEIFKLAGGNPDRLHVYDMALDDDDELIDILRELDEMEAAIKETGARLVILDALNSFIGGDVSTDSKARRSISGKLQKLAVRSGACIIGIQNWGRSDSEKSSHRAMGAKSLSDVARCVFNTKVVEIPERDGKPAETKRYLEFEKVSDAQLPKQLEYKVKDLSDGDDAKQSHRRIQWLEEAAKDSLDRAKKR